MFSATVLVLLASVALASLSYAATGTSGAIVIDPDAASTNRPQAISARQASLQGKLEVVPMHGATLVLISRERGQVIIARPYKLQGGVREKLEQIERAQEEVEVSGVLLRFCSETELAQPNIVGCWRFDRTHVIYISPLVMPVASKGRSAEAKQTRRVYLKVEQLPKHEAACEFDKSLIESVATSTLGSNDVAVTKDVTNPFFYVAVNGLLKGNDCAMHLHVSLRGVTPRGTTLGGFSVKDLAPRIMFCESGAQVITSQRRVDKELASMIKAQIKECLAQLHY